MSARAEAFPLSVPSTAEHGVVTLLNRLPSKILLLFLCLHPCKLWVNYKIAPRVLCTIYVWWQHSSYLANVRGY